MPLVAIQLERLKDAAIYAVEAERRSNGGSPASVAVAQWAPETGWGKYTSGTNNCLGIKEYKNCYGRELCKTREWFTDAERDAFVALGDRRKIVRKISAAPRADGRNEYEVMDWFATFPDIAACFEKRMKLLRTGRYRKAADLYSEHHGKDGGDKLHGYDQRNAGRESWLLQLLDRELMKNSLILIVVGVVMAMLVQMILADELKPTITVEQRAKYWRALSDVQAKLLAFEQAKWELNRIVSSLSTSCGALSLKTDNLGEPICEATDKKGKE